MLSSTADPREIADKYALAVPVFTWNTVDYPDMKMTGPERHVDFETHRPGAGLRALVRDALRLLPQCHRSDRARSSAARRRLFGTLYLQPQDFGWGKARGLGGHHREHRKAIRLTPASSPTRRARPCMAALSHPRGASASIIQDSTFHFLTASRRQRRTIPTSAALVGRPEALRRHHALGAEPAAGAGALRSGRDQGCARGGRQGQEGTVRAAVGHS